MFASALLGERRAYSIDEDERRLPLDQAVEGYDLFRSRAALKVVQEV